MNDFLEILSTVTRMMLGVMFGWYLGNCIRRYFINRKRKP